MHNLTNLLIKLTNAQSSEELWPILTGVMADYGFDRLIYGYTPYRSGTALGDSQDWRILTNYSDDYMEHFIGGGLYTEAPMVTWALSNVGACSWSYIDKLRDTVGLTEGQRKIVEFNRKMGVKAGYTISFRSVSSRGKGAMALAGRSELSQREIDDIWSQHGDEIMAINNVAHLKLLTLPFQGARRLTPRQIEVLEWVGDGKTTQDVATILGVSAATVEKHLRLAREALDVDTTAQAILKAASFNQMFVPPPEKET